MWTHDDARRVIQAYVDVVTRGKGVIVDEQTLDRPYGWVFFYESRAFLETRQPSQRLLGNAPLIFNRVRGEYSVTGTAGSIHEYLAAYEAKLPAFELELPPQVRTREPRSTGDP